jgi:DNA-binding PadR family transcriptional regulator
MSTRLLVLGLLNESPKHGYEIQKWLEQSRTDTWANVLPGSIYHALQQFQKEGLVQVSETPQVGHRLKAVYAITDAGRSAFKTLLRQALQQVPHAFPSEFYTALVFVEELPRQEVRSLVEHLIPQCEQEIASWEHGQRVKNELHLLPEYLQTVFANGREHLEADLRLLYRLRDLFAQDQG